MCSKFYKVIPAEIRFNSFISMDIIFRLHSEKMRTCRSPIFEADLKLHLYGVNEICPAASSALIESGRNSMDSRQIPSSVKSTSQHPTPPMADGEFNWKWLQDEPGCKRKLRLHIGLSKTFSKCPNLRSQHIHTRKHLSINWEVEIQIYYFAVMFIDRTINATNRIKQMCTEQRLQDFKRNARILTALKQGKRKRKVSGKCYGMNAKN